MCMVVRMSSGIIPSSEVVGLARLLPFSVCWRSRPTCSRRRISRRSWPPAVGHSSGISTGDHRSRESFWPQSFLLHNSPAIENTRVESEPAVASAPCFSYLAFLCRMSRLDHRYNIIGHWFIVSLCQPLIMLIYISLS